MDNYLDSSDCYRREIERMDFIMDTVKENKELNEALKDAQYRLNMYLIAFINLTDVLQGGLQNITWPMAAEMGNEEMGRAYAEEYVKSVLAARFPNKKPKKKK